MRNAFGGLNPNGLYVPMSDLEQEALSRLVESGDLRVHVVGWGVVNSPRVTFGDARLQIRFRMDFDRPAFPMEVYYFDLELRTGTGLLLSKKRFPTTYDGKPVSVAAGIFLDYVWDIAIEHIDPRVVRALVPDARGFTSRLQDKDTGEMTRTGNMKLNSKARRLLEVTRRAEALSRKDSQQRVAKVEKDAGE